MPQPQTVIAYVDGFNLYYGLRDKRWKRYYWLNIQMMVQHLLRAGQNLVRTKYFTAVVNDPPDKHRRQSTFLDALRTLNDFDIYFGHFLWHDVTCFHCGQSHRVYKEKMTDVNIATELLSDAFQGAFDTAFLVSADGDLVGPVRAIRRLFPSKRVVIAFPPKRHSAALAAVASARTNVGRTALARSQFPDRIVLPSGHELTRPSQWH